MHLPPFAQRGIAVLSASAALAAGGCEVLGGPADKEIVVHPVTLEAEGFGPAIYDPTVLQNAVTVGWLTLARASGKALPSEVEVTVEPIRTVNIPKFASVADICSGGQSDDAFGNQLVAEVGQSRWGDTRHVIVLKRAGYDEATCPAAITYEDRGAVVVFSQADQPHIYAHEFGHTEDAGHDNQCDRRNVCQSVEYGNPYTIMGSDWDTNDPDPYSAFALKQFGAIGREQIHALERGDQQAQVELVALSQTESDGIKLITIPTRPTTIHGRPTGKNQKPKRIDTASSVGIELSHSKDDSGPLGIKVYALGRGKTPGTYLIPETGSRHTADGYALDVTSANKATTYAFGGRRITITIKGSNPQSARVEVRVADVPGPR